MLLGPIGQEVVPTRLGMGACMHACGSNFADGAKSEGQTLIVTHGMCA